MGLERPSSTCKNVLTFAKRKANIDCWELEWTQCWDVTHEVDDWTYTFGKLPKDVSLYTDIMASCFGMQGFVQ